MKFSVRPLSIQRFFGHGRVSALNRDVSIVIPTINSASYIDLVLDYYASLGLVVTVFVDRKTTDETLSVCKTRSRRVLEIFNPTWRVEYVIKEISLKMGTRWVLRMDDDELPSIGMLDYIARTINVSTADVVGFPRYQCAVDRTGKMFFHRDQDPFDRHRQFRLYRPESIDYQTTIHSPGFIRGDGDIKAPADAAMIHLDWTVHSYSERVRKVQRYDAETSGMGTILRDHFLPEEQENYEVGFIPFYLPEFRKIGQKLATRFPDATISRIGISD